MINFALGFLALTLITSLFLDPVTQLPFGMEVPLQFLAETLNVLKNTLPWMATVYEVFLIGLFVKIALWVFDKVLWLIQLIRGG